MIENGDLRSVLGRSGLGLKDRGSGGVVLEGCLGK
jgi:hypothetical protein